MPRLASTDLFELRETSALRERRETLLREADKHRYRLHYLRGLTDELRQVTAELLRLELAQTNPTKPTPLGDAGTVGKATEAFDFYKD